MTLEHARYCDAIIEQSRLLDRHLDGADLSTAVPSCPGWNVGQLVRHLGGGHRWARAVVTASSADPIPDDFRDLRAFDHERAEVVRPWFLDGAAELSGALRAAGPDRQAWSPVPGGPQRSGFYARRMTHETALHRADAALALGLEYSLDTALAVDAIDEWLDLATLPEMLEVKPAQRALLAPGRTVHLHATDVSGDEHAEWVIDLGGPQMGWRRAHEKCAVAARGPLVDLLLALYRRTSPDQLDVVGDRALLDEWLGASAFG
jgi:uncharacterized protein (TIGR03083 family)